MRDPIQKLQSTKINNRWKNRLITFGVGAILPICILSAWQISGDYGLIDTFFLPTPLTVVNTFGELIFSGELFHHVGISLTRTATGFMIGGLLGLIMGITTGFSQQTEKYIDPTIQFLRLIPHLAVAPLIILWFGFGETSKVLIIANGSFFPLYLNAFLGIRSVDNKLFEVSRVLQFSHFKQIIHLILPASVPNILIGLRLSLTVAWLSLVIAELLNSQSGIGYLISFGQQNSQADYIFVGLIIFAIIGKLMDSIVHYAEQKWLIGSDRFTG